MNFTLFSNLIFISKKLNLVVFQKKSALKSSDRVKYCKETALKSKHLKWRNQIAWCRRNNSNFELGEACAPSAALSDKERGKIENFEIYYFLFEIQIKFFCFLVELFQSTIYLSIWEVREFFGKFYEIRNVMKLIIFEI